MHMAWMRAVTGRMKSNYMYSVGVVYNTFPLRPGFAEADTSALEPLAQAVLDARAAHEGATLADLHDAGLMPPKRPKGASGTGSWSRSPLPPEALHVGARTRRVPVRAVRASASTVGCRSGCEAQTAAAARTMSAAPWSAFGETLGEGGASAKYGLAAVPVRSRQALESGFCVGADPHTVGEIRRR